MNNEDREHLINNIVGHMKKIDGPKKEEIINRQLCHFFRANVEMGMRIAAGLQIKLDENIIHHAK
jgi:catalase